MLTYRTYRQQELTWLRKLSAFHTADGECIIHVHVLLVWGKLVYHQSWLVNAKKCGPLGLAWFL